MDTRLPLIELAIWTAAALPLWLLLTAALARLQAPLPAVLGASLGWVLARWMMSGMPGLLSWAAQALSPGG
jgi:hypothetical protein